MLSFSFFIIFGLLAPRLFGLVFGAPWVEAGLYAQWMSPWYALVFICSPLSILPSVLERQGQEALFSLMLLLGRVGVLIIGGLFGDIRITIQSFAALSTLGWLLYMLWMLRIAGNKPSVVIRVFCQECGAVIIRAFPIFIALFAFGNNAALVIGAALSTLLLLERGARKLRYV